MTSIEELSTRIADVAERAGPAVVGRGRGWEVGSGFVLAAGEVVVAAHGLRSGETAVVFSDERRETARVVAVDADLGLALVSVDTGDLTPVAWAADAAGEGSPPPGIGTPVVALASPGGRGLRATLGFVTSAPRSFRGPRGRRLAAAIEHTAPLPRGSAGGPLVDLEGRLLGVNLVRASGGLILALPADGALRARLDELRRGRALPARRLGVAIAPPRVARRLRSAVGLAERDGLLVRAVEDGSAGERAGLRQGDLIVTADGRPATDVDVLHEALETLAAGAPLSLTVVRGSEERELRVSFDAGAGD